jgi:MOSC domain-containing protein YiiM
VRAGDFVEIAYRPPHDVTVTTTFKALTTEPDLLPLLLAADAMPDEIKEIARKRAGAEPR